MSKELLGTDVAGHVDYSLPIPVSCWNLNLEAATVKEITTPPNFNRAFFSYQPGTNVFVSYDGNDPVFLAPGGSWDFPVQELNPAIRQININGGQTLKFLSDTNAVVNVRFDLGQ